jgi:uncharacterized protein
MSLVWIALLVLPALAACRDSTPLPPGNWQGRCAAGATGNDSIKFGPAPTSFVRDRAKMLRDPFVQELEMVLSKFQMETCHQLGVVSVASLEGTTIDAFARDYANRMGLGYRRLNNGALLFISPQTRQTRIQIGCGLEDVISDAQASEILQRDLMPMGKEGEWEEGIRATLTSLMKLAGKKTIDDAYRPDGCRSGKRAN